MIVKKKFLCKKYNIGKVSIYNVVMNFDYFFFIFFMNNNKDDEETLTPEE